MGKVNDYINKLIKFIKNEKPENKEKPWLKYYGDVPESLNYFNGSMYDYLKDTASKNEKRSAYSFYGNEVTFKSFMKKIDKVASALKKGGGIAGDAAMAFGSIRNSYMAPVKSEDQMNSEAGMSN